MRILQHIFGEGKPPATQLYRLGFMWVGGATVIAWVGFAMTPAVFLLALPLFVLVTSRLFSIVCPRCGARAYIDGIFFVWRPRCPVCKRPFQ